MRSYIFGAILVLIAVFGVIISMICVRKKVFKEFTNTDLMTIALFGALLYLVRLPFHIGLTRILGMFVNAFVMFIPYCAVLVIGIRLIPKVSALFLMILIAGVIGSLLHYGPNPVLLVYYLLTGLSLEMFCFITGNYARSLSNAMLCAALVGVVGGLYQVGIALPLFWHMHIPLWLVITRAALNGIAGAIGAVIGYRAGISIEKAIHSGAI